MSCYYRSAYKKHDNTSKRADPAAARIQKPPPIRKPPAEQLEYVPPDKECHL